MPKRMLLHVVIAGTMGSGRSEVVSEPAPQVPQRWNRHRHGKGSRSLVALQGTLPPARLRLEVTTGDRSAARGGVRDHARRARRSDPRRGRRRRAAGAPLSRARAGRQLVGRHRDRRQPRDRAARPGDRHCSRGCDPPGGVARTAVRRARRRPDSVHREPRRLLGRAVWLAGGRVGLGRSADRNHPSGTLTGQGRPRLLPRHHGVPERPLHGRPLRGTHGARSGRRLLALPSSGQ